MRATNVEKPTIRVNVFLAVFAVLCLGLRTYYLVSFTSYIYTRTTMKTNFFLPTDDKGEKFILWWQQVQKRGQTDYIVRRSLVFAPLTTLLFLGLQIAYDVVLHSMPLEAVSSQWSNLSLPSAVVYLIGLSAGSIICGWLEWHLSQWRYNGYTKARQTQQQLADDV